MTDRNTSASSSTADTNEGATLKVAVGSSNPSKLRAVKRALERVISRNSKKVTIELHPFSVPSGVPDQPFGDEETGQGALNRCRAAYQAFEKEHGTTPHLAVGLEGGLEWFHDELLCMAWMEVQGFRSESVLSLTASKDCSEYQPFPNDALHFGNAKTSTFALPPAVAKLVKEGMELGDADDKVFSRIKSKHGSGTVGILTDGLIDRSAYYEEALILALIPWIRPDVYPDNAL